MGLELIKTSNRLKGVVLCWLLLLIYLIFFFQGTFESMDNGVYQLIHSFESEHVTQIMKFITFFGSTVFIVGVCFVCFIVNRKIGLWVSLNMASIALINQVIKWIVARPRPSVVHLVVETSYSFPSAHAMCSFVFYALFAFIIYQKGKKFGMILMVMPLLIGITRIYLGVHYTSDVLAGYLFALTYFVTILFILFHHKKSPCS